MKYMPAIAITAALAIGIAVGTIATYVTMTGNSAVECTEKLLNFGRKVL